uniref:Uncharacterized protein n=1 Tax=viral metagenome TaxID=1070528 RepID=A0A6H1ZTD4_9ZZZZ
MTNVKTEIKNNLLIITVNLDETHGPSKSGKTEIVASTQGFTYVSYKEASIGLSVNVCKKK